MDLPVSESVRRSVKHRVSSPSILLRQQDMLAQTGSGIWICFGVIHVIFEALERVRRTVVA